MRSKTDLHELPYTEMVKIASVVPIFKQTAPSPTVQCMYTVQYMGLHCNYRSRYKEIKTHTTQYSVLHLPCFP